MKDALLLRRTLEFKQANLLAQISPTRKRSNIYTVLCEYKLNTLGGEKSGREREGQGEEEEEGAVIGVAVFFLYVYKTPCCSEWPWTE